MSDKKRTTVTTIETHEVWIIRRATVPELAEEAVTLPPLETTQPAPVLPLPELNKGTETNEEEGANEQGIGVP